MKMTKLQMVKEYLKKENVKEQINKELDLMLDNNYGETIQFMYALLETDKNELGENFRTISKDECIKLKWQVINATLEIIQRFITWDNDVEVSQSTIKKGMKELNFYNEFNNHFVENLNGDIENIKIFKRWFIKK